MTLMLRLIIGLTLSLPGSGCSGCGQTPQGMSLGQTGTQAHREQPARCRVIVLEDNDVVHLRTGAYGIFNATITERHTAVPRLLETLNMEVSQIMKGGYDTFMQARAVTKHSLGSARCCRHGVVAPVAWGLSRMSGGALRLAKGHIAQSLCQLLTELACYVPALLRVPCRHQIFECTDLSRRVMRRKRYTSSPTAFCRR